MPVKKPAAKKAAAPAKKTAAAPAKKTAPAAAKKAPAKSPAKDVDASDREIKATVDQIAGIIKSGALDGYLTILDDALTERVNKRTPAKKTPAKAPAEKKVSPAPKREPAKEDVITPEANKNYVVRDSFKPLAGAKVKFIRFKADDHAKSVVEMVTDKPGSPKGKRVMIPTRALGLVPAAPAKKAPAKKK